MAAPKHTPARAHDDDDAQAKANEEAEKALKEDHDRQVEQDKAAGHVTADTVDQADPAAVEEKVDDQLLAGLDDTAGWAGEYHVETAPAHRPTFAAGDAPPAGALPSSDELKGIDYKSCAARLMSLITPPSVAGPPVGLFTHDEWATLVGLLGTEASSGHKA